MVTGNDRLSDAVDAYLASRRHTRKAAGTVRADEHLLRRFVAHTGNILVRSLTPEHVERWLFQRCDHGDKRHGRTACHPNAVGHLDGSSWNNARLRIKALDQFLREEQALSKPIFRSRWEQRRSTRRRMLFLDSQQLTQLINAASHPRDRAFIALGAHTALRASEIINLRIGDVELVPADRAGWIHAAIIKSKKLDRRPVTAPLYDELTAWFSFYRSATRRAILPPEWRLVPARRNGPSDRLNPARALAHPERIVHDALEKIGVTDAIHVGAHTLRRSAAAVFFESMSDRGYDGALEATSRWLNHSSIETTRKYLNVDRETRRRDEALYGQPFLGTAPSDAKVTALRDLREEDPGGEDRTSAM